MKKTLVAAAVAMMVMNAGVHAAGHAKAAPADASAAIEAAKKANKAAKAVGYEWRDTGKMIKKAEKLAKAGKTAEAVKLANTAKQQGELAQDQYKREWERAAPRF